MAETYKTLEEAMKGRHNKTSKLQALKSIFKKKKKEQPKTKFVFEGITF
jgi:hypothetical protein